MMWQDIVIGLGQWLFVLALLPSVFGKNKPALSTSLMTGTILGVFAITFATLNLLQATISATVVSLIWFVLAFQKFRIDKKKEKNKQL